MPLPLMIHDLHQVSFREAYRYQTDLRHRVKHGQTTPFHLVFCEHEPVITKGRNFVPESLPFPLDFYQTKNISVEEVDRGGDVTFHGPGQITAYFIFDLNYTKKDVHLFIHQLEDVVIECLKTFGVPSGRNPANSGVWVGSEKICAIGVGFKHWISYHGIGFNINTDMNYFKYIIPCGLRDKGVTSLKQVLKSKTDIDMHVVAQQLIVATTSVFQLSIEKLIEECK